MAMTDDLLPEGLADNLPAQSALLTRAMHDALQARMERLEGMQELLCHNLAVPQMIEALQLNGIEPSDIDLGRKVACEIEGNTYTERYS